MLPAGVSLQLLCPSLSFKIKVEAGARSSLSPSHRHHAYLIQTGNSGDSGGRPPGGQGPRRLSDVSLAAPAGLPDRFRIQPGGAAAPPLLDHASDTSVDIKLQRATAGQCTCPSELPLIKASPRSFICARRCP